MESEKPKTKDEQTKFELDQRAIRAEETRKAVQDQLDSTKAQLESIVEENERYRARIKDLEKVEDQAKKTEQQMVNVVHEKEVQIDTLKSQAENNAREKRELKDRIGYLAKELETARAQGVEAKTQADERFRAIQDMKELVRMMTNGPKMD